MKSRNCEELGQKPFLFRLSVSTNWQGQKLPFLRHKRQCSILRSALRTEPTADKVRVCYLVSTHDNKKGVLTLRLRTQTVHFPVAFTENACASQADLQTFETLELQAMPVMQFTLNPYRTARWSVTPSVSDRYDKWPVTSVIECQMVLRTLPRIKHPQPHKRPSGDLTAPRELKIEPRGMCPKITSAGFEALFDRFCWKHVLCPPLLDLAPEGHPAGGMHLTSLWCRLFRFCPHLTAEKDLGYVPRLPRPGLFHFPFQTKSLAVNLVKFWLLDLAQQSFQRVLINFRPFNCFALNSFFCQFHHEWTDSESIFSQFHLNQVTVWTVLRGWTLCRFHLD